MRKNSFILLLIVITLTPFIWQCSQDELSYKAKVKRKRFEKDKHFKYADASPLREQQQMGFRSLNYFPVKKKYRVIADVQKVGKPDTIKMAYTNGEKKLYSQYAKLKFDLHDQSLSLFAYKNLESKDGNKNTIFIPFYDRTNGHSTYEGGRYLDKKKLGGGDTTILDFNQAYNPYCTYNGEFTCPIPPEDNRLDAVIRAGEKKFDD